MAPLKISVEGFLRSEDLLESTFCSIQVHSDDDDDESEERPRKRVKLESGEDDEDCVPIAVVDFKLQLPPKFRMHSAPNPTVLPFRYALQNGVIELKNIAEKNRIVGTVEPKGGIDHCLWLIFAIQTKLASCKPAKSYHSYLEARE